MSWLPSHKNRLKPTFPCLNSQGLDSTESQGEEYSLFTLPALGVISMGETFSNSCELTLFFAVDTVTSELKQPNEY